jgi:hypothetical protein
MIRKSGPGVEAQVEALPQPCPQPHLSGRAAFAHSPFPCSNVAPQTRGCATASMEPALFHGDRNHSSARAFTFAQPLSAKTCDCRTHDVPRRTWPRSKGVECPRSPSHLSIAGWIATSAPAARSVRPVGPIAEGKQRGSPVVPNSRVFLRYLIQDVENLLVPNHSSLRRPLECRTYCSDVHHRPG